MHLNWLYKHGKSHNEIKPVYSSINWKKLNMLIKWPSGRPFCQYSQKHALPLDGRIYKARVLFLWMIRHFCRLLTQNFCSTVKELIVSMILKILIFLKSKKSLLNPTQSIKTHSVLQKLLLYLFETAMYSIIIKISTPGSVLISTCTLLFWRCFFPKTVKWHIFRSGSAPNYIFSEKKTCGISVSILSTSKKFERSDFSLPG